MADSSTQTAKSSFDFGSVIGGALDTVGSLIGGLFNANQAKKNRQFQERMYQQQVRDNIRFWQMQNDYNLPSAQLQRLKDAGLNPLLMYGDGASGAVAANQIQSGQAPHGAQGQMSMHTNFGQQILQGQLLQAQIENMRADTEQKLAGAEQERQSAANLEYDVMFKRLCQNVNVALKHGSLDEIFATTDKLRQETYASHQLTLQTVLTMMQARQYEVKRFNWDVSYMGEALEQRWQEIKTGRIAANAQMKNAAAAWLNASANWNLSKAQVGQIGLNMSQSREMFPLLKEGQERANKNAFWDNVFKGVQIDNAKRQGFQQEMDNFLITHGVDRNSWLWKVAGPFVLPSIYMNEQLFHPGRNQPVKLY